MSSYAPSPSLQNLFSELEQLLQTETEARVSTRVRVAERVQSEHLNQSLRRLRQAAGFAEIAAVLCDACAPFCNDCAVFRVDNDNNVVTGECRRGTNRETNAGFREVHFVAGEAAAFAGAIESREPVVAICSAVEISPALRDVFGPAAEDKAHLFPLTVDGTTLGVLYTAGAVESAALELLAQSAAIVLECRQEARQKPAHPSCFDCQIRAAIGSATTTIRNVDAKPRERAVAALSLGCLRMAMRPGLPGEPGLPGASV